MIRRRNISDEQLLEIANKYYTTGSMFKSNIHDNGKLRHISPYDSSDSEMEYSIQEDTDISAGERVVWCNGGMECTMELCSNPYIYSESQGFCPVYVDGHGWIEDILIFEGFEIEYKPISKFGLKI